MSDPAGGRVESMNQLVRAVCVLVLLGGFVFVFVWGVLMDKVIVSNDAYIGVLSTALVWWFKSRDEKAVVAATVAAEEARK